jgi:ribosomal protein S12 methylthiotransferase accessory factor
MSAGNTEMEARSQALSEILERHIKFRIISEGMCLPDVPEDVIARYPRIAAGIAACATPVSASWSRMPRSAANTR